MLARRRLLPFLALALLLWPAWATTAQAHAVLLFSDPADGNLVAQLPAQIRLLFSEPVQPIAGGIIVVSPSGRRVQQGAVRITGTQMNVRLLGHEPGSYVVIWQIVSADTHPSRGRLVFSVGHTSATADVGAGSPIGLDLQVLARWLHFLGLALAFGTLLFRLVVIEPVPSIAGRGWPSRFTAAAIRRLDLSAGIDRCLGRLMGAGVLILLVAEGVSLVAQTTSLGATGLIDPALTADVLASSFGRVLAQRVAAALLLWALLGTIRERGVAFGGLLIGVALTVLDGEAAHATSSHPAWVGYALNALHIGAMTAWVGGLLALLAIWHLPEIRLRRREILAVYGKMAAVAVGVLATSGAGLALQHLGNLANLYSMRYGQALAIKSVLFMAALSLVALVRRRYANISGGWWRLETGLLTVVLALAGVMVSLPPGA